MINQRDLFGVVSSPTSALARRFGVPPFSVLSARDGEWQERKRKWLALGIQSELGRGGLETNTPHVGKSMADGLIALRAQQKAARNE